MGTHNLCRRVPADLCLGKSEMSHDKAITMCCEALETHIAGKKVAPHLYPVRRLWLLQGPAAGGSSVAPFVAVRTELCCNEYKGGSLLKLLSAYRPCNSCWLSGFQTGCLMLPHKVSLSLGLASVATKELTKGILKFSLLPVLFAGFFCSDSPHALLDAFCSKAYFCVRSSSCFHKHLTGMVTSVDTFLVKCFEPLLCCLGWASIRIRNWKFITWNWFLNVKLTPVSYYLPSPEGRLTFLKLL